ncbi:hypothetical protein D9M73_132880 [compost metagenome]
MLGDGAGLIRLDRPDEMPGQRQVGQFDLLAEGFLQVVLAEIGDAGGERLADVGGGLGLAHRQQADARGIAPRSLRRLTDTRANLCNIVCYRGHYLRSTARPEWGLRHSNRPLKNVASDDRARRKLVKAQSLENVHFAVVSTPPGAAQWFFSGLQPVCLDLGSPHGYY